MMTPKAQFLVRLAIGTLQIIGGTYFVIGFISTLAASSVQMAGLVSVAFLGFALSSVYSGILLAKGDSRGIAYSKIIQWLQVPHILGPVLIWTLGMGPQLQAAFVPNPPDLRFTIGFGFHLHVWLASPTTEWAVGVNVTAAVCVILLSKLRHVHS